ncbi:hypothetical protein LTS15_010064 [Exophiala xenobiotica]|nr:hypothetical protein LTS15_010064 [Exophiala xenobiotica]
MKRGTRVPPAPSAQILKLKAAKRKKKEKKDKKAEEEEELPPKKRQKKAAPLKRKRDDNKENVDPKGSEQNEEMKTSKKAPAGAARPYITRAGKLNQG